MGWRELNRTRRNEARLERFFPRQLFARALLSGRLEQAKITKTQKTNVYI